MATQERQNIRTTENTAMMITAEMVSRMLERMSAMSAREAQSIVKRMGKEQPAVLAYLLAMSQHKEFNKDEGQIIFYIGMVIWRIVQQQHDHREIVTETQLDEAEKANEGLLEKMASDSPGDFLSAVEAMIRSYPERELLRYVTEALMEDEDGNPDNPPIRDENLGLAFLHLKIIMDALIVQEEDNL